MVMTKFNEETRNKIIYALKKGATYKIACNYARIDYSCLWGWMQKGKEERESEYGKFLNDIKEAEGETALKWLEVIDNAMVKEWTAAAWKLERRYFKDYSANPVVRTEMLELQKVQEEIKSRQEALLNGGKTKEVDPEGSQ